MSKEEVISSLFQPTFGNRPLQYKSNAPSPCPNVIYVLSNEQLNLFNQFFGWLD